MSVANPMAEAETVLRGIADLVRSDRHAEAQAAIASALAAGTPSDALLGFAAMLAARQNDPATAARHLETLVARRPDDRAARINLAQALIALDRFDRVAAICAPMAGDPAADALIAFAAQQTGDLAKARFLYRGILARFPNDVGSWANLGNIYLALDEFDAAIDAFERAITLQPGDARLYLNLAGVLERVDRSEARARVMRTAARVQPDDPAVQLALGLAEARLDDFPAAEAALRRAIALRPQDAAAWLELGMLLENANRLADLETLANDARVHIGAEIALLDAWIAFRHKRFDDAQAHAEAMGNTLNPIRRFHLQGEIADRRHDSAAAFDFFRRMNAASLAAAPIVPPGPSYRETVAAGSAALRVAAPRQLIAPHDEVPMPIFVMGFPRSGTTLLDTILGRLPDTIVLEEQPLISAIEYRVGGVPQVGRLDDRAIARHRRDYLADLLRREPAAVGARVVDKNPLHMAVMPLIDALFPRAPILFVERHPFDVVLSCFMSNFKLNRAMRSFTDIEEAALTYDAVLTAWTEARTTLGLNVHAVRYERLVADTEGEMRAALDFIGADYDPAILDNVTASKERGRVRTASYAQISEPIYRRSVARWERYRAQLEPVRPILTPWADRLGYQI